MEEKPVLIPIPENYDSQFIFLGLAFRKERIIEAVLICAVISVLIYSLLLSLESIEFSLKIGIALSFSFPPAFLSLKGIDDEDLFGFLFSMFKTRFLVKDAYYDETIREKRVKKEKEKKVLITLPSLKKEVRKSEDYIFEDDLRKERLWLRKR